VSHERPRFAVGRSEKTCCLVLSWTITKIFQFSNSDQRSKLRCCDVGGIRKVRVERESEDTPRINLPAK
jgi:hypothetical protein